MSDSLEHQLENLALGVDNPSWGIDHILSVAGACEYQRARLSKLTGCSFQEHAGIILALDVYCLALWLIELACSSAYDGPSEDVADRAKGIRRKFDPVPICPHFLDLEKEVARRCVDSARVEDQA